MVEGVNALKLDQALHGYSDGHRQLALSATLKPRDQKTLLSLSDISGPGGRVDEGGYITGYPLTDSGFYALARTWPAPEMPRPGCVWTHTILIDFADLPLLKRPEALLRFFRRPDPDTAVADYSKHFSLPADTDETTLEIDGAWAQSLLSALYSKASSAVVARRTEGSVPDRAVVAIWGQQWPRLRRSFRFCTLSISDRSSENHVFDLQLVSPTDRAARARFAGSVDIDHFSSSYDPWIVDALSDLRNPNIGGLRDFFRRVGSDISSGRKGFSPLCRLYRSLGFADGSISIGDAISVLQHDLRTNEAGSLRSVVVNQAFEHVEQIDEDGFDFLWSHRDLIDPAAIKGRGAEFGLALWRRDPRLLQSLNNDAGALGDIVEATLQSIDLDLLINGLSVVPELGGKVLRARPEVVGEQAYWSHGYDVGAFQCASLNGMQSEAVEAMMDASRSDLANLAVTEFGAQTVLDRAGVQSRLGAPLDPAWIYAASRDPLPVARFLSGETEIQRSMLLQLAQFSSPDSIPNEYGADPWVVALKHSSGTIPPDQELWFSAFLLSRALGYRSRSRFELMQAGFQVVYEAAAANRLTPDQWEILTQRLPSSVFWYSWDRCKRLRVGVVDTFMNNELNVESFAWVVEDERILSVLAEEAATKAGGRRFLKAVRNGLKNVESVQGRRRLEIIDHILG